MLIGIDVCFIQLRQSQTNQARTQRRKEKTTSCAWLLVIPSTVKRKDEYVVKYNSSASRKRSTYNLLRMSATIYSRGLCVDPKTAKAIRNRIRPLLRVQQYTASSLGVYPVLVRRIAPPGAPPTHVVAEFAQADSLSSLNWKV